MVPAAVPAPPPNLQPRAGLHLVSLRRGQPSFRRHATRGTCGHLLSSHMLCGQLLAARPAQRTCWLLHAPFPPPHQRIRVLRVPRFALPARLRLMLGVGSHGEAPVQQEEQDGTRSHEDTHAYHEGGQPPVRHEVPEHSARSQCGWEWRVLKSTRVAHLSPLSRTSTCSFALYTCTLG